MAYLSDIGGRRPRLCNCGSIISDSFAWISTRFLPPPLIQAGPRFCVPYENIAMFLPPGLLSKFHIWYDEWNDF